MCILYRCSSGPEERVQELQAVTTDEIIELMSQVINSVDDLSNAQFLFCKYDNYGTVSCKRRSKSKV